MSIKDDVSKLRAYYDKLPRYVRNWFFPKTLGATLYVRTTPPHQICAAFEKVGFFSRLFFSGLRRFYKKPYMQTHLLTKEARDITINATFWENFLRDGSHAFDVALTLQLLKKFGLLSGTKAQHYFDTVLTNRSECFADVLCNKFYSDSDIEQVEIYPLFTGAKKQQNFEAILLHPQRNYLSEVLHGLHTSKLLNEPHGQKNFERLLTYPHLEQLSLCMTRGLIGCLLNPDGQINFEAILSHQRPRKAAAALSHLNSFSNLLRGERAAQYRNAVLTHPKPEHAVYALITLMEAGLLTDINQETVLGHNHGPYYAAMALVAIKTGNFQKILPYFSYKVSYEDTKELMLSPSKIRMIMHHKHPISAISALIHLKKANLLAGWEGKENYSTAMLFDDPESIAVALVGLNSEGLLSPPLGDRLRKAIILTENPSAVIGAVKEPLLDNMSIDVSKAKLILVRLELEEIRIQLETPNTQLHRPALEEKMNALEKEKELLENTCSQFEASLRQLATSQLSKMGLLRSSATTLLTAQDSITSITENPDSIERTKECKTTA